MQSTEDLPQPIEDLLQSMLFRAKDTRLEHLKTLVETLRKIESDKLWNELDASILERLSALVDKEDELLVHNTLYVQAALDCLLWKYRSMKSQYRAIHDHLLEIAKDQANVQALLVRLDETDHHFTAQILLHNLKD